MVVAKFKLTAHEEIGKEKGGKQEASEQEVLEMVAGQYYFQHDCHY